MPRQTPNFVAVTRCPIEAVKLPEEAICEVRQQAEAMLIADPGVELRVVRRSSPAKTVQHLKESLVTDADDNPYFDPGSTGWTPLEE